MSSWQLFDENMIAGFAESASLVEQEIWRTFCFEQKSVLKDRSLIGNENSRQCWYYTNVIQFWGDVNMDIDKILVWVHLSMDNIWVWYPFCTETFGHEHTFELEDLLHWNIWALRTYGHLNILFRKSWHFLHLNMWMWMTFEHGDCKHLNHICLGDHFALTHLAVDNIWTR